MKTFTEWCEHYEYDPASPEAKADYERYREQLALFQELLDEPCFLDDDQPLERAEVAFLDEDGPSPDLPHRVTLPRD